MQMQGAGVKIPPQFQELLNKVKGQPWSLESQQLVERVKTATLNELQRAERTKHEMETKAALVTMDMNRAHEDLYRADASLARTREANLEKVGQKPPSAALIAPIKDRLHSRYDDDPYKIDRLARATAERAQRLMQDNNQLTHSEAARAAYLADYSDGKYSGMTLRTTTMGSSAAAPLPMPKDPWDTGSWTEGQHYNIPITKNGKVVGTKVQIRTDKPLNDPDAFVDPPEEEE
jgi:hypothetical protein